MVITTLDDVKNVMTSFKALCDAYVFKPVGTAQLLNQLESLDWFHKSYKFGVIATLVEFEPGGFQFQENLANIFLKRLVIFIDHSRSRRASSSAVAPHWSGPENSQCPSRVPGTQ